MSEPTIVNLTPHAITIPETARPELGAWTLPPSGRIARALEIAYPAPSIGDIPTSRVGYSGVEGLPDPEWRLLPNPCDRPDAVDPGGQCFFCGSFDCHVPGVPREPAVYYVISTITADAARRIGRTTEDLLVPGQQIRDDAGRIIGCQSLARIG